MKTVIKAIVTIIIVSFYFFPFEFKFLPGINTKMALAVIGLCLLGINLSRNRLASFSKDFFQLSLWALAISIMSIVSTTYNHTNDYSFVGFIVSMWVWLSAAYCVIQWIHLTHETFRIETIINYLLTVCVIQCVIAYSMDIFTPLKDFINSFLGGDEAAFGVAEGRLYGIGAALDVAGFRFAAVLVMLAYLSMNIDRISTFQAVLYILSFLVLAIIGNMISRSTTIGVVIALIYWLVINFLPSDDAKKTSRAKFIKSALCISLLIIPIIVYLYTNNPIFRENLRFGFEGFFSLAETGKWQVGSNDILLNHMIVFPDEFKTWILGDGYSANPYMDPYYVGPHYHGYYMGTDIGYLRFIFYFGIIGMLSYVLFILKSFKVCTQWHSGYSIMFFMVLIVNLIGWAKVATDIFLVFALFICFALCCKTQTMSDT